MPSRRYSVLILPASLFFDLLLINLSLFLLINIPVSVFLIKTCTFFSVLWLVLSYLLKVHEFERTSSISFIVKKLIYAFFLHFLTFTSILNLAVKGYVFEDLFLVYVLSLLLVIVWRMVLLFSLQAYRRKGYNHRNVAIVGYGSAAEEMRNYFLLHPEHGFKFLGFFGNDLSSHTKLRGDLNDLKSFALNENISELYCCLPYLDPLEVKDLVDFGENNFIKINLIADYSGVVGKELELRKYGNIPVVTVSSIPLDELKNRLIKRTFDVVFTSLVLVFILSWLVPIIAFLIKLDSKGPVFFKQKRTGKDNQPFMCFKFRTMTVNKDCDKKQAIKNDIRITKVGAFLRKTSIDELPQFFNVLSGDMSVVGPRPHMIKHTEEYRKLVENFMTRHQVKPGITGLAQAKGYRGETKELYLMKNRVKMDRFYISNWTFLLDLKIIVLTVLALYKGDDNAY